MKKIIRKSLKDKIEENKFKINNNNINNNDNNDDENEKIDFKQLITLKNYDTTLYEYYISLGVITRNSYFANYYREEIKIIENEKGKTYTLSELSNIKSFVSNNNEGEIKVYNRLDILYKVFIEAVAIADKIEKEND